MKKAVVVTAALALLTAGASAVPAQTQPAKAKIPSAEKKWYVGAGLMLAINHIDYGEDYEGEYVKWDDFDNSWGLNLKAGYYPIKYLAVEGNFGYAHKFSSSVDFTDPVTHISASADADVKLMTFTVNGKGYPLPDGMFRPYAILGLGYGRAKADYSGDISGWGSLDLGSDTFTGAVFRGGVGLDVFFSEKFAVEAEVIYNRGTGDLGDVPITQIGANALLFF
ncbi:MAG TPA: porin family protein [bacterium]|nr:porin family protein [bacterium]HPJ72394.1 porin family protein [bacterium]HPQ66688.1 porin family protein [bacterium]